MIPAQRLAELRELNAPSSVVSLYLRLDPAGLYRGALQRLLREARSRRPHEDLAKVERHVLEGLPATGRFRSLAVFSAGRLGLWQTCLLPETVKNRLVVDSRPALAPLLSQAAQHQRYGVALVGLKRARYLEAYMGESEELGDQSIASRGDSAAYLKQVAERLESLARRRAFDRVVLGVSPDMAQLLINQRPLLENNLILDPDLDAAATPEQIAERIFAAEGEARKVRESVLVHRLCDAAGSVGRTGVLGLKATLDALRLGRVRVLYVRDGLAKLGRRCPCGRLSLEEAKCVLCARTTEAVFDLVEEMIQAALDSGREVVRILYDSRLDGFGKIGAELSVPAPAAAGAPADSRSQAPEDAPRPCGHAAPAVPAWGAPA